MMTEVAFRRYAHATGAARDVALLDVAQDYVLEYMRREGLFEDTLVFKVGTALRKYVFGADGRFSVDLDFALRADDPADADLAFDLLDGAEFAGIRIDLERRRGTAALLRLETPLGPVVEPAAVSVRPAGPWLPPRESAPQPFALLDRGLAPEFARAPLPVLDPREMAAEKIAAFWRRRAARDLYNLDHLGQVLQTGFDGPAIAELAALKIYADVALEGLGHAPNWIGAVFGVRPAEVRGADDLGRFRAVETDAGPLLERCRRRYDALRAVTGAAGWLATHGTARDRWRAREMVEGIVARLTNARLDPS